MKTCNCRCRRNQQSFWIQVLSHQSNSAIPKPSKIPVIPRRFGSFATLPPVETTLLVFCLFFMSFRLDPQPFPELSKNNPRRKWFFFHTFLRLPALFPQPQGRRVSQRNLDRLSQSIWTSEQQKCQRLINNPLWSPCKPKSG